MSTTQRRTDRTARQPTEHLHELAHVERLLRADTRPIDPIVRVDRSGARITFETWPINSHTRGSLTAAVVNEIAATDAWGVATIHDPHRGEENVQSMLTVVYDGEGA